MSGRMWIDGSGEEFRFAMSKKCICSNCGKSLNQEVIVIVWKNTVQLLHPDCITLCKKELWPDDVI